MRARYKIISKRGLLLEETFGKVSLDDLKEIVNHQLHNPHFRDIKKVYTVLDNCELDIKVTEIDQFSNFLMGYLTEMAFRWAVKILTPQAAVLTMLFKADPFFEDRVELFSTEEAAFIYLGETSTFENLMGDDFETVE